ncbi:hypothetical protein niasHT_034059 [Heterodera trifolii]|uniref:RING-type domain-containing protein n=1 Tax=Heterodera trifolii TaxID=157864 RepID=A0ABD2I5B5_9BILA
MAEEQQNQQMEKGSKESNSQNNETADESRENRISARNRDKQKREPKENAEENDNVRGQRNNEDQRTKQRQGPSKQWTRQRPQHQQNNHLDAAGDSSANISSRRGEGSGRNTPTNVQQQHRGRGFAGHRGGLRQNYGQWSTRQMGDGGQMGGTYKRIAKQRFDHAGVPMSGQVSDCLICCQRSDVYGVGECLHPICMECALRMRIGSDSRQCPQCRAEISTLFFVSVAPGMQMAPRIPTQTLDHPEGQKFGFKFESNYVIECFNAYMANRCFKCSNGIEKVDFPTFAELRAHMSQVHQLSFCHICCDNLNVLTKDRRVYTRDQLQRHMAGRLHGEADGFRGHPTCQFCEQRFYDDEQQYRHLRKDHYFCQFCDQDGLEQNVFYRNQHQLNQHNRKVHHPCTDPDCLHVGIVFRTDTELDVHRAKHHRVGGGSRAIPLDIQFSRSGFTRGGAPSRGTAEGGGEEAVTDEQLRLPPPALSHNQPPVVSRFVPSAQHQNTRRVISSALTSSHNQTTTDFPGLPTVPPPILQPYGAPPGWAPPPPSQQKVLSLSASTGASQLSLHSREQFPILSGASSSTAQQQQNNIWGQKATTDLFKNKPEQLRTKKEEPKRSKVIPPPDIWPEGMQEQLKARELGLPDPHPIVPPHWLNPPKKEKKKKTKTVPIAQMVANKIAAESAKLTVSSTKFNTLLELGNSIEEGGGARRWENSKKVQKTLDNCWDSEDGAGHVKLTPSDSGDPGFMRIELSSKLRLVGQTSKDAEEDEVPRSVSEPKIGTGNEGIANSAAPSCSKFSTLAELANSLAKEDKDGNTH